MTPVVSSFMNKCSQTYCWVDAQDWIGKILQNNACIPIHLNPSSQCNYFGNGNDVRRKRTF